LEQKLHPLPVNQKGMFFNKETNMKTIALILIGAVFLITSLPLIQVQAGGPYTEKIIFDEVHEVNLCEFPVSAHLEGVMVMKTWFDMYGKPVRSLVNYRQRWTYSANGITLKANTGGPSHVTFLSPTRAELRYTGAYTLVTARGKGVVYGSAGQGYELYELDPINDPYMENPTLLESTFVSGIDAFWDPTEFCAALTP
jgi:hypothetical protein